MTPIADDPKEWRDGLRDEDWKGVPDPVKEAAEGVLVVRPVTITWGDPEE